MYKNKNPRLLLIIRKINIKMNSSSPAKMLTWSLIQPYLEFLKSHQDDVDMVIKFKDKGKFTVSLAEEMMTKSIIEMHDVVSKILNENSII
jgi:hypothetical protein